jgi:hypothetical protein
LIEVTRRDCASGSEIETFQAMNSFVSSGTLMEYATTPFVTPAKRTPGFGNWRRVGWNRFRAVHALFFLPDSVNIDSLHRIERTITMTAPDRFTAKATNSIFSPGGDVLIATGCATENGKRIS